MREIIVAHVLLTSALFAWVLGVEADEIAVIDVGVFAAALAAILILQFMLLYVSNKALTKLAPGWSETILLIVAAVLLGLNAYFLALIAIQETMEYRVAGAVLIASVFALAVYSGLRPVLMTVTGVVLLALLMQYGFIRASFGEKAISAETVSLPISSRRNVYIIGVESLQSPAAYKTNYRIEDAEHVKVLEDAGFRVVNAFSADGGTLRSFAGIFEFARDFYRDQHGARSPFIYGNSTFRSFRDSGYRIQVIYKKNYFIANRKLVDYSFPPPSFDACETKEEWFFYGLCRASIVKYINKRLLLPDISVQKNIERLRQRAELAIESSRPWLTWIHINHPSHTSGQYRYPNPDYVAKYVKTEIKDALPDVTKNMQNGPAYIAARDPNAIIAVFGDHGTKLYRGLTKEQVLTTTPIVPLEKVLLDQNGVMLAIYPRHFCKTRIGEGFSTKALIESIIACLNGDDSPTDEERKRARTIRFFEELWDLDELQRKRVAQPQRTPIMSDP